MKRSTKIINIVAATVAALVVAGFVTYKVVDIQRFNWNVEYVPMNEDDPREQYVGDKIEEYTPELVENALESGVPKRVIMRAFSGPDNTITIRRTLASDENGEPLTPEEGQFRALALHDGNEIVIFHHADLRRVPRIAMWEIATNSITYKWLKGNRYDENKYENRWKEDGWLDHVPSFIEFPSHLKAE